jgi:hypothetical protein
MQQASDVPCTADHMTPHIYYVTLVAHPEYALIVD